MRKTGPKPNPEVRFTKMTREGSAPDHRPELGPCLLHSGASNGNGYAQFHYDGKNGYAHRYAWEREAGPIPSGLTVDHLCRVRRCVRFSHLELTDRVDNYLRGVEARSGTCPNGHERTPQNTTTKNGRRACLLCREATSRRSQERRRKGTENDSRVRYDQNLVREQIAQVRAAQTTIAQAARVIGCQANYLGRRVWTETRKDVLARDGGRCVGCGMAATDVHHRIPRGSGGSSRPEIAFGMSNLISLCRNCHSWTESNRDQARENGLLVPRSAVPADIPVNFAVGTVYLTDDGSVTPC